MVSWTGFSVECNTKSQSGDVLVIFYLFYESCGQSKVESTLWINRPHFSPGCG